MNDERVPHFFTDSSGRLTFDLGSVPAADFPAVCKAVMTEFHLTQNGELVIGPDQMFWDFRSGDHVVGLDWDVWFGFMVVAQSPEAEPLVRAIATWVCTSTTFGISDSSPLS